VKSESFPALFVAADSQSNDFQEAYLNYVRVQYFLLLVATVCAFLAAQYQIWKLIYVAVLTASGVALLFMSTAKPEKDWYKFRALAESVKTRTWLFVVGGDPFGVQMESAKAEDDFLTDLKQILDANAHVRERITRFPFSGNQISEEMRAIRMLSIEERKSIYLSDRIQDQKNWYIKKAAWNDRKFRLWVTIAVIIHVTAIGYVLFATPEFLKSFSLPVEVLLVSASAVLGWMQIKRFNELAASYALTAHEISMAEGRLRHAIAEGEFAKFVAEAELLFSREHTQWAARQPN
jgi:SMODS and SLOG-associating 2TM effector domain 3/SMODS and SLOG-associating 2TM effector domain 1